MLLLDTGTWLDAEIGRAAAALAPSRRIEALRGLAGPVLGFVSSASLIGANDLREEADRTLCVDDDEGLLACVVEVLRTAARAAPASAGDTAGLAALRTARSTATSSPSTTRRGAPVGPTRWC